MRRSSIGDDGELSLKDSQSIAALSGIRNDEIPHVDVAGSRDLIPNTLKSMSARLHSILERGRF